MLYEVITGVRCLSPPRLSLWKHVGANALEHLGRHAVRFAQRRMRVDRLADVVITSYSIHYTKLYEQVSLGRVGPRNRQCPRRGLHQAAVRCRNAPHRRSWHRRNRRRRSDQRARARDRDGRGCNRHRQDDPSASHARRIGRHGGRDVRGRMHRSSARAQAMTSYNFV